MASTTRETQMMGDASDLRHHFNTLMNNTSCLTNGIKLLSQQTLQHGSWMKHHIAFVASDAWRSFSPLSDWRRGPVLEEEIR